MVVGTSADYPPFEYYDSAFQLDGFDIALMREIGKKLGVDVVFRDAAFEGLEGGLTLGQMDAAISAISVTPGRAEVVDFSNVYYVGNSAALAADSWTKGAITSTQGLKDLRIGVQGGTVYQSFVQHELVDAGLMPQANLNAYLDVDQAINDLKAGRIDVVLLDAKPAKAFEKQGAVKVVGEGVKEQNFAIALPPDQAAFRRVINRALSDLRSEGAIDKLAEKYLGVKPEDLLPVPTPVPEPPTPAPAPPLAGNYALQSLNGKPLAPGTQITANFSNGQLTGSGGCNNYTSTYTIMDGNRIAISPPVGTQMMCDDATMQQEREYFQTLPFAFGFQVAGSALSLYNDRSVAILQYAKGG